MQIVYVQDQEVVRHKGRYYHSKSKHYFERYLAGLMPDEKLKVLSCCLDEHDDSKMTTYQDVTNKRVEFVSFPNFRKLSSYINIYITIKRNVSNADFCYIRTGISGILSGHICRKKKIPYMFIINEDMEANLKTNKRKLVKYGASLVGRLTKHYIT